MLAAEILRNSGLPPLEARALLAHVMHISREQLVAHPERPVDATDASEFATLTTRRQQGVPLAYLVGVREFYGREFRVTPDVLIPRPDTETLIEVALACLAPLESPRVLDLGTGCGCIAITLKLERPDAQVTATDRSSAALRVARENALALGAEVELRNGDWYAALTAGASFDLIVANPPYVAAHDAHLADLKFEPTQALTDGGDGLSCLRAIIGGAPSFLTPPAWLAVEHGFDQASPVAHEMRVAGFKDVATRRDSAGHERVTCGQAG
jgi:release factor glutamine methyltransferase